MTVAITFLRSPLAAKQMCASGWLSGTAGLGAPARAAPALLLSRLLAIASLPAFAVPLPAGTRLNAGVLPQRCCLRLLFNAMRWRKETLQASAARRGEGALCCDCRAHRRQLDASTCTA